MNISVFQTASSALKTLTPLSRILREGMGDGRRISLFMSVSNMFLQIVKTNPRASCRNNLSILLLLFLCISTHPTSAQWTTQNPKPSGYDLTGVSFIDTVTGWAVGKHGTILHTTNGGVEWVVQKTTTTADLYGVSFVNGSFGWAVGGSGAILSTSNGGRAWYSQVSNITSYLNAVQFLDSLNGWAVGVSGKVLKTTNGGISWQSITNHNVTLELTALSFTQPNYGFIVGRGGTIKKTTD
ncbi:MAG: hypothetical protein HYZ34_14595, partial [Ignavibacteriae bacterium]|nr:hypothetical protein [Ignavibacteriota bacterium]